MRLSLLLLLFSFSATAQELYVFTEPASNMAARSIGLRASNYLMYDANAKKTNYHLVPELMWGISKRYMVHLEAFVSNRNRSLVAEGAGLYVKYRFYSADEVHSHFRMAAFARYSFNNSDVHQRAIDLNGHNTGYESGLVATKLVKKTALSASASFLHAADNGKEKFIYANPNRNAVSYTVSAGRLMLPVEYTSYRQTNVNLMLEMLGQTNLGDGNTFLDMAPSVQFIFLSRMRADVGYRFPLINNLSRTAPSGFMLRLEYNIFNAY